MLIEDVISLIKDNSNGGFTNMLVNDQLMHYPL
jgi:hypothetical protein